MNIYKEFETRVVETIEKMGLSSPSGQPIVFDRVKAEPPRDPSHGDIATNAAMVLAKQLGTNPRDLAQQVSSELTTDPDIETISVAGPGFINMKLSPSCWQRVLRDVVVTGEDYGKLGIGNHSKINVEYVSANPTGPMHVGHCRGAVVGDSLANLLEFAGYDVTREYYINDAGAQIDKLAQSVFLRYREALGEAIGQMPEGLYPGDYLKPVGQALVDEFGPGLRDRPESEWMPVVKDRTIDAMMDMIREDLAALNIEHDVFFSERTLHEKGEKAIREAINDLTFKGYVYQGKLPPPKGQVPEDWEDREQTLFNSTEVGDDIDRPLIKSDGSYTYFAADVAYFRNKYERGFAEMIYVLGADHGGYVKRLEAVAKAVSAGKAKLTVLLCQLVKLFRDGEPVRMSKRSGEFVTLRDVVDEVGRDPVRFMMLYRKNSEPLDFDFAKVTDKAKENPVFYVQYAHARCHSVFREARETFPETDIDGCDFASAIGDHICDQGELQLVAKLAEFPRIVESAALAHEPHRIAFYLYDLAGVFHSHWNRGREKPELRFVNRKNRELTLARLALVKAVEAVLKSGLGITGTDAPTEMR